MGAVGPLQFVLMINGLLRVFNKSDGSHVNAFGDFDPDLDLFFQAVMTPVSGSSFNYTNIPRIRFDRYSNRWILLGNDVPGGLAEQSNRILLAVSDGPVISQSIDSVTEIDNLATSNITAIYNCVVTTNSKVCPLDSGYQKAYIDLGCPHTLSGTEKPFQTV